MDARWFAGGVTFYLLTAVAWFVVMKFVKLSTIGLVYSTSTILFLTLIGFVFFKERLNTVEVMGFILGVIAIFLLGRFAHAWQ